MPTPSPRHSLTPILLLSIPLLAAGYFYGPSLLTLASTPATTPTTTTSAPAATQPLATPRNDLAGLPNFAQISPTLYRGAQPTEEGFAQLKKMGVKTVVNLRFLHSDRDKLKGTGLQYVAIPSRAEHPEDEDIAAFLQVVADPANQPVFVHCQAGADRTGCAVAAYRIVVDHWTPDQAAAELPNFNYHPIFTQIKTYLAHFTPANIEAQMKKTPAPKVETIP